MPACAKLSEMTDIDRKSEYDGAIPCGVWPTMITPLTDSGEIDYDALGRLVDWYIERGVHGLFAVCQSSEMFFLSLAERIRLAEETVSVAAGRVPVIASGHVSDGLEAQAEELLAMSETGVDAVVLVNNRLAGPHESDEVWETRTETLLSRLPNDLPLGWYECPYPYKRVFSSAALQWAIGTGRFGFFKDTCCDLDLIAERAAAADGTGFGLYNANAASILYSLRKGYAGYSGVMANFHPQVYVRLFDTWRSDGETAEALQDFLGCASRFEGATYPANAKYYLTLEGVAMSLRSRRNPGLKLAKLARQELVQLRNLTRRYLEGVGVGSAEAAVDGSATS